MSFDFSDEEGRGYADDDVKSPSSSLGVVSGQGAKASPSRNSSDLLVDSDAPEEVAINVDSTDAWDGKPRVWPVVPGYDRAPHEVRQIPSSFYHRRPFKDLMGNISLVKAAEDATHFKLAICQMTERVCHGRGRYPNDFFYVYATMFKDLKVLLPFSDFQMGVLRTLNVAPTQLHPNGWAFMQVFSPICSSLALRPTPAAFLYFFHVQPHSSKSWVSLRTIGDRHLLTFFNSSYKDFKGHFFKVVPLEAGYQMLTRGWRSASTSTYLPKKKALFSGMTEEEASDMAMELAARSKMCLAYAAQKRASASTDLQALQEKFDAAVKSNQDVTLRLAETERMAEVDKKKTSTLLAEARATQCHMQRSLDDAMLDLQKAATSNTKLTAKRDDLLAERDSLQDRVTKLEADNKLLGDEVMNEHLLGMMVVDNKLVPIHVPPPPSPVVPHVEAAAEVVVETDGADVHPFLPLGLGLRSSVEACPRTKVRVHERNLPHTLDLGLRSSLEACPKTKVRVHERNLPHLLGLGLRSSLEACPKTKVRVYERNLPHTLDLGLRSSLEACPKTKVRVHERNLPHLLGLGLRSSLEACLKTKVRVHERNLPHPLGLGLTSS
ncbi:hypothetical protein LR48_Vigan09g073700 [Vigna angularis]|uniref:Transposase (putative) gypsy type domain-containing protein n=1 Tax=Phaseolus angularis TaxID=3914 RepID=A0A0L9VAP9_PHAAN|nr:hypothetical protein LR48_Vigan09g073700 [Vigna angularis]